MRHEVFLVMVNRRDKQMPGVEKSVPIFYDNPEEAQLKLDEVRESTRVDEAWGIYRCEVNVLERVK